MMNKFEDKVTLYFGIGIVMASIAIVVLLIFYPVQSENKEFVFTAIGIILGWGGAIVTFKWGSSQGSKDKTNIMGQNNNVGSGDKTDMPGK